MALKKWHQKMAPKKWHQKMAPKNGISNICEVVNDVNKISNQTFVHENINYVDKSIEMNKSFYFRKIIYYSSELSRSSLLKDNLCYGIIIIIMYISNHFNDVHQ